MHADRCRALEVLIEINRFHEYWTHTYTSKGIYVIVNAIKNFCKCEMLSCSKLIKFLSFLHWLFSSILFVYSCFISLY